MEAAAKTGTAVLVKHNMEDGFKSGIQIPESIEIAKEIEKFNVNGIVLSSGFVSRAPMAVMRGRIPTKTMSYYMGWNEWLQKIVVDLFGQWMIKDYKFEECNNAFSGEKSELFANKKQRGPELWISRITAGLSIAFFVLAIITSFFVDRM